MTTQGTKEWASSNINLFYGCANNCMYCYAKKMALRFGRIKSEMGKLYSKGFIDKNLPLWEKMANGKLRIKDSIKNLGCWL